MLTPEMVHGAWRLVGFNMLYEDGSTREWRANAHGILIYSSDGFMSVSINSKPDTDGPEDYLDSLLFYSGRWSIVKGDEICHEVMNATSESRIGQTMIRRARRQGDDLLLVADGPYGRAILTWRKPS